jgi:hypothetical protein
VNHVDNDKSIQFTSTETFKCYSWSEYTKSHKNIYEKFGDTKVVIRSDKLSKGRQYNEIKRKEKKTKQWTTERLIKMSPIKTGELWCFGKVNSFRYTSVCRCVARIKNAVKNKIENNVCHCVILKPRLCKDKHH